MSRRRDVRITLGERGVLRGVEGILPCFVVELSTGGARLGVRHGLPHPPLTLTFAFGNEVVELPVAVHRLPAAGRAVVRFDRSAARRLEPLIEAELERAEASGRRNVVERRAAKRAGDSVRGEVL